MENSGTFLPNIFPLQWYSTSTRIRHTTAVPVKILALEVAAGRETSFTPVFWTACRRKLVVQL